MVDAKQLACDSACDGIGHLQIHGTFERTWSPQHCNFFHPGVDFLAPLYRYVDVFVGRAPLVTSSRCRQVVLGTQEIQARCKQSRKIVRRSGRNA